MKNRAKKKESRREKKIENKFMQNKRNRRVVRESKRKQMKHYS